MRFSLRSLLIALTYAAISIGLLAAVSAASPSKVPGMLGVVLMFGGLIVLIPILRARTRLHPSINSPMRNTSMSTPRRPIDELETTIADRAAKPSEKSYTSQLLAGGVARIGAKVTEEAAEVVQAADEPGDAGREHFIREVGDLIYHLLVLMRYRECSLADVEAELARRFGVSGLEEKASRKN